MDTSRKPVAITLLTTHHQATPKILAQFTRDLCNNRATVAHRVTNTRVATLRIRAISTETKTSNLQDNTKTISNHQDSTTRTNRQDNTRILISKRRGSIKIPTKISSKVLRIRIISFKVLKTNSLAASLLAKVLVAKEVVSRSLLVTSLVGQGLRVSARLGLSQKAWPMPRNRRDRRKVTTLPRLKMVLLELFP